VSIRKWLRLRLSATAYCAEYGHRPRERRGKAYCKPCWWERVFPNEWSGFRAVMIEAKVTWSECSHCGERLSKPRFEYNKCSQRFSCNTSMADEMDEQGFYLEDERGLHITLPPPDGREEGEG